MISKNEKSWKLHLLTIFLLSEWPGSTAPTGVRKVSTQSTWNKDFLSAQPTFNINPLHYTYSTNTPLQQFHQITGQETLLHISQIEEGYLFQPKLYAEYQRWTCQFRILYQNVLKATGQKRKQMNFSTKHLTSHVSVQ